MPEHMVRLRSQHMCQAQVTAHVPVHGHLWSGFKAQSQVWALMSGSMSSAGVAVWRERGGPALLADCPHRASPQALHRGSHCPCPQERPQGG